MRNGGNGHISCNQLFHRVFRAEEILVSFSEQLGRFESVLHCIDRLFPSFDM